MARPARPKGFAVHDVWAPETPNSWGPGEPVWTRWIKANCRSRQDIIEALRRVVPVKSSGVIQVVFTDTDGQRYGIAIHIGTWYTVTRYEWNDQPDVQCFEPQESTSFGPHDAGLDSWHGEGHA
jgi:hypothetical protein